MTHRDDPTSEFRANDTSAAAEEGSTPAALDLDEALHVAIRAAEAAAQIQRAHTDQVLRISTKSTVTDLVTQVDVECEARIREILLGAYPDHVVLGEEQGQQGEAEHRWIVDPLDGTLNYAHGFPFYCVSIALEVRGRIELGVVLDSTRDELFQAVRGRGASRNGRPIAVTTESEPIKAMLATGFAYVVDNQHENIEVFARVLPKVRSIRRPGAAALDLSYVACGRLDGFWELKLSPWDVAAGLLIVQEAGGTVTAPDGGPYRLGDRVIVASNGHLHGELLGLLDLGTPLA